MAFSADKSEKKSTVLFRRIAVGLVMTCLAIITFSAGAYEHLELKTLSLRQKYLAARTPVNDVVNIDVDNASLEEIGRWPWPRQYVAGVIETLNDCGAKVILLDIIFPHPQQPRYVSDDDKLLKLRLEEMNIHARPVLMFDDLIFEQAVKKAGNVFVPIQIDNSQRFSPEQIELLDRLDSLDASISAEEFYKKFTDISPNETAELFLRFKALRAVDGFELKVLSGDEMKLESGYVIPPVYMVADVMRGTGFVNFNSDSDSIVRRMSLLAKDEKNSIFPQLALAVAGSVIGGCSPRDIVLSFNGSDELNMHLPNGVSRKIPVDDEGRVLLYFAGDTWKSAGQQAKNHLQIAAVAELWLKRGELANLDELKMQLMLKFLSLGFPDDIDMGPQFGELNELAAQRNDLFEKSTAEKRMAYHGRIFGEASSQTDTQQEFDKLRGEILAKASEMYSAITADPVKYEAFTSASPDKARQIQQQIEKLPRYREYLTGQIDEMKKLVSARTAGKICLVGTTAAGAPDFVPTPLDKRTPGVVIHANIINMMLTDSFLFEAKWWQNVLVVLAAGIIATLITARFGIVWAFLSNVAAAAIYVAFDTAVLFVHYHVVVTMIAPVAAMALVFVGVVVYRAMAEAKAKRQIKALFSHALSPQLVDKLLADPSIAQLGGQNRPITCMYTDLAGFTPLSGKLGPRQTVAVLNRYFDCVTRVVQEDWGGYINKFLGDGVFAFFGAPVDQDDHPARALRAAIEYQEAVAGLNETLQKETPLPSKLKVRIGLTTDDAMVGNCGSSKRMDYTAIGDVVNISARLEAANKFFGTGILAKQQVMEAGGSDDIIARPMPKILVNGVAQPVRAFQVIALAHDLDENQKRATKMFAEAISLFDERKFQQANEIFMEIQRMTQAPDRPLEICIELCRQAISSGDPENYQPGEVNIASVIKVVI